MAVSVDISQEPAYLSDGSYSSDFDRRWFADLLRDGIVNGTDFLVSAGAGFTVNVSSGKAYVSGQNVDDQGMYRVREPNTNTGTITIPAADLSKPRIDQLALMVMDASNDTSGNRKGLLKLLQGVATTGATLTNRTGAADLTTLADNTKSVLLLSDILVPAGVSTSAACIFRDRRKLSWPRNTAYVSKTNVSYVTGNSITEDDLIPQQTIPGYFLRSTAPFGASGNIIRITGFGHIENTSGGSRNYTFKLYTARGTDALSLTWGDVTAIGAAATDYRPIKIILTLYVDTLGAITPFLEFQIANTGTTLAGNGDLASGAFGSIVGQPFSINALSTTNPSLDVKWKLTTLISGAATPSTQVQINNLVTEVL